MITRRSVAVARRAALCPLLVFVAATSWLVPTAHGSGPWKTLEAGLDLARFETATDNGKARVDVLRIDARHFTLRLLNASATDDGKLFTPRQWAHRYRLVATINASMYQEDYRTSVSLMKSRGHTNQRHVSKDKAILAFDPLSDTVPRVQIIDRTCQNFADLRDQYGTLVQSIRMVSCRGNNVWSPQDKKWSTAAIGVDHRGRVLFVHASDPLSTHDLIDRLLALPIDLKNAMYVEGGRQAQLYVHSGDVELELTGRGHGGLVSAGMMPAWPIPNVIGVARTGE